MKTKDLAISAIGIVFVAICAQISINTSFVPFSLQLFGVTLIALTLTSKQAKMSIIGYVLLGLIGLPVFAGYKGGLQSIFSPTFGFILGFIIYVYVIGLFKIESSNKSPLLPILCSYSIFYLLGLMVLSVNLNYLMDIQLNIDKLILSYWFVFIPSDLISIFLALILSKRLKPVLQRKSG